MNCKTCKNKNRFCTKESLELGYCDYHQTHTGNFDSLKKFDKDFPVLLDEKGRDVKADVRCVLYRTETSSWFEGYETAHKDAEAWERLKKNRKYGGATA